jgi:mannose-6-phosphate isomerase
MLYPYRFQPILVERVWGGDTLARYGKALPPGKPIGESWEISDRADAQSILLNGPLAGQTLRQLIEKLGYETIVGGRPSRRADSRFPLLIKLLDARERLSLQVHPPSTIAPQLGGEPKTEMWYIMDAAPDAHLIAGLKKGTTRAQFQSEIRNPKSKIADLLHRFPVKTGDALFVPSGRLHAIDAGLLIAEIQQNSDTTYRVFDWGRTGRALHIEQSLASIDFNDFEPSLTPFPIICDHFRTDLITLDAPHAGACDGSTFHILACVAGELDVNGERLRPGEFSLLPAALGDYKLVPLATGTRVLLTTLP